VVATTRDVSRLLGCLASIEHAAGDVSYEVVVVLSGADDDVVDAARTVRGVRLAESRWNLGFAGACNLGRAEARGELIVLLHDDAEAEEGWLPALVDAAERHPDAGVIGGRVLKGDSGRLQLAGAVMFSDARSALLGSGAEADAPEHMFARPIDYSSSCSLLVRAQTWDEIGGADDLMFPGGYVDADLGMAAWAAGWTVRYEPSAVVRHRQLGTMTAGFKAYTHGRNRDRFRGKWAAELELHEPWAPDLEAAAARAAARAEARAEAIVARGRPEAPAARGASADPDLGPRLATLELRLCREYIAALDPELERLHREYAVERRERLNAQAELEATRSGGRRLWPRRRQRPSP
jgi:GT2 family glycosyltransferase